MSDHLRNRMKVVRGLSTFLAALVLSPLLLAGTSLAQSSGPRARIVVIPTAGGAPEYTDACPCAEPFRSLGVTDVTVLHTYDPVVADESDFVSPIAAATGVWFSGGRQWRLVDAYAGTRALEAFREVPARGGVIGGSSVGATIQGSYLARGDTKTNTVMMGDHQSGFGFLSSTAVDQHVLRRNRHFDLLEIVEAHPELLGIGIDEDTAIVVSQDTFEVIGRNYILIYDAGTELNSGAPFYFLAPGDVFDLGERRPVGEDVRGLQERLKTIDQE
jgi:cyanophycinase